MNSIKCNVSIEDIPFSLRSSSLKLLEAVELALLSTQLLYLHKRKYSYDHFFIKQKNKTVQLFNLSFSLLPSLFNWKENTHSHLTETK